MECSDYRRSILADPNDRSAELRVHVESCPECTEFNAGVSRFEAKLDRALRVNINNVVPFRPKSARGLAASASGRRGWLALAAGVVLSVGVAGGLWLGFPRQSLARDVVAHIAHEPQSWNTTDVAVPEADLTKVLRDSHLTLRYGGVVSYASSCGFRGHHVPHLVVQSEKGPVTVMVLVHESVSAETHFDEQGYSGVIVPIAGHGSVAVLERGASVDPSFVERVAASVVSSIVWSH